MYARNLERILARLCVKSDPSHAVIAQEYEDRFNSLRGYGRLPRGREQREQKLSNKEIASAIFGLVAQRPSWAGHVAIILESLCPVGGTNASFFDAATLGEAVQILLTSEEARKSLVRLSLTASETGVSSNGGAELICEADGAKRHVHFVHKMVISLAQPGAENGFDPDRRLLAPVTREMTFHQSFFRELARECELAARHLAPPEGDGSEYDAEEARQRRYEKLGVRRGSRFLNLGVDAHLVWPKEELLIRFDRYSLVLMPATKDNA
ncbi:MAG: hypothetical protein F9K38_17150 [Pseudorhodoplanes sp.]|nr:MAG: hypothetical protein F9K38_17150 [Pseudorhodoplanes sp.]